jgi:hypothetical protein
LRDKRRFGGSAPQGDEGSSDNHQYDGSGDGKSRCTHASIPPPQRVELAPLLQGAQAEFHLVREIDLVSEFRMRNQVRLELRFFLR